VFFFFFSIELNQHFSIIAKYSSISSALAIALTLWIALSRRTQFKCLATTGYRICRARLSVERVLLDGLVVNVRNQFLKRELNVSVVLGRGLY